MFNYVKHKLVENHSASEFPITYREKWLFISDDIALIKNSFKQKIEPKKILNPLG